MTLGEPVATDAFKSLKGLAIAQGNWFAIFLSVVFEHVVVYWFEHLHQMAAPVK